MLASLILRRFSCTDFVSSMFFSAMVVSPMIAFIGVRISCDIMERKSVFARLAAAASFAADWSFLLKRNITAKSKTNRITSPAETTPIRSQFSVSTLKSFIGIKESSVHPSVAAMGVKARMHSSPREFSMVVEPVVDVISPKSSSALAVSTTLYER